MIPPKGSVKRLTLKILAGGAISAVVGAAGLAAGVFSPGSDTTNVESAKARMQPPATSAPAPVTTHAPTIEVTTTPSTTLETIPPTTRVKVVPRATVPKQPTSTTHKAAPSNVLSEQALTDIIQATNFQGLRDHKLEVLNRFDEVVIVGVDGSKLLLPLAEIKADLAIGKKIAASRPSFTLGSQGTEKEYQAGPSSAKNRYIFVTDNDPQPLALPVPSFEDGFTTNNPAMGLNVTIVRNQPGRVTSGGIDMTSFSTAVEACQTETTITVNSSQAMRGQEVFCNSWGYAVASARAGRPYADYALQAAARPLTGYEGDFFFAVSQDLYNSLV